MVCAISVLLFILFASITLAMMKYVDFSAALNEHSSSTGLDRAHPAEPRCGRRLTTTCLSAGLEAPLKAAHRARATVNGKPDQAERSDYVGLKQSSSDNCLAIHDAHQRPQLGQEPRSATTAGTLPRKPASYSAGSPHQLFTPVYLQSEFGWLKAGHNPAALLLPASGQDGPGQPASGALVVEPPPELASLILAGQVLDASSRQLLLPLATDQSMLAAGNAYRSAGGGQQRHLHLTGAQGAHLGTGAPSYLNSDATIVFSPVDQQQRQTWQSSTPASSQRQLQHQVIDGPAQPLSQQTLNSAPGE